MSERIIKMALSKKSHMEGSGSGKVESPFGKLETPMSHFSGLSVFKILETE
jgi:hypothetical protein